MKLEHLVINDYNLYYLAETRFHYDDNESVDEIEFIEVPINFYIEDDVVYVEDMVEASRTFKISKQLEQLAKQGKDFNTILDLMCEYIEEEDEKSSKELVEIQMYFSARQDLKKFLKTI